MPVIYYDIEKQNSLKREPYAAFARRFKIIKNSLDGQEINIRISTGKEGFAKGFYTDSQFSNDANLHFVFAKLSGAKQENGATFVRMTYSFECNDCNYRFYHHHIMLLKKRVPYFYFPFASHFEFSAQVDDEFKLQFDILVEDEEAVQQACYCLINQIITIFSFED